MDLVYAPGVIGRGLIGLVAIGANCVDHAGGAEEGGMIGVDERDE